ncbi:hypothetical protein SVAN01_05995 [Stagonosporopsis vannaccii]|nr:hypothetical protein SVAN01_05995 [Stagonosporopsis vannaccii]
MPPRKQKIIVIKPRKANRPRKRQPSMPHLKPKSKKLIVKLKLNPNTYKDTQFKADFDRSANADKTSDVESQGTRPGRRQRRKTHHPDMVFGSEMDHLITSSVAIGKVEAEEDVHMDSSPPIILNLRTPTPTPTRQGFPDTIKGTSTSLPRSVGTVSQDVQDILNTLKSSPYIQVDLPNVYASGGTAVIKPYTAKLLIELYIQCYQNQLWHFCDLVADTWIRALQAANKRTQRSENVEDRMWRKNVALDKIFAEKKKGFKEDLFEFGSDIEDPELASDVTIISAERLHELYAHTNSKCGGRLLWADAIALSGRKAEHDITRQPGAWPEGLFFDVMCTSLRMMGRKLTLKIEEKYEGAWCRYHEHGKHGVPCYRRLAWEQKDDGIVAEDEHEHEVETDKYLSDIKGKKRAHEMAGEEGRDDIKRVRFDTGADSEVHIVDSGDIGGEDKSE